VTWSYGITTDRIGDADKVVSPIRMCAAGLDRRRQAIGKAELLTGNSEFHSYLSDLSYLGPANREIVRKCP